MKPANFFVMWTCFAVCGPALSDSPHADGFRVLHTFLDSRDGASPLGGLMEDRAGNLYGTALQGGADNDGVVFKVTPDRKLTTLYAFKGGSDGRKPQSGLTMDATGNLYGTTYFGGGRDCGTVYKVAPDGTETLLHAFAGSRDGANPYSGVVLDKNGNIYGTTLSGGADNNGTVYRIAPDGSMKVLHTFTGGDDGDSSYGGLIAGKNGDLYGTAIGGGAHGFGVVFEITPNGAYKVLYAFGSGNDGQYPEGGLVADKSGNFYGTTRGGGLGNGTVFKLAADGNETVLYALNGTSDGSEPYAGVARDKAGNLYGTAVAGGQGYGTAFKVAPDGTFTLLHTFTSVNDGEYPEAVIIDGKEKLYGVAYAGGAKIWGTVFELKK
jgi:uncharacterized repeat protein (TIGR03803 family)